MTHDRHVTIDDDADLGFALACLISRAISASEFREWVHTVSEEMTDAPEFLQGLSSLDQRHDILVHWPDVVGFWPSWEPRRTEDKAITGIAYARFPDHHADDVTRSCALATLGKSRKLSARFAEFFPSVRVPELVEVSAGARS